MTLSQGNSLALSSSGSATTWRHDNRTCSIINGVRVESFDGIIQCTKSHTGNIQVFTYFVTDLVASYTYSGVGDTGPESLPSTLTSEVTRGGGIGRCSLEELEDDSLGSISDSSSSSSAAV